MLSTRPIEVFGLTGIREVVAGTDIVQLVIRASEQVVARRPRPRFDRAPPFSSGSSHAIYTSLRSARLGVRVRYGLASLQRARRPLSDACADCIESTLAVMHRCTLKPPRCTSFSQRIHDGARLHRISTRGVTLHHNVKRRCEAAMFIHKQLHGADVVWCDLELDAGRCHPCSVSNHRSGAPAA